MCEPQPQYDKFGRLINPNRCQPLPRYDKFGRKLPPDLPWLPSVGPEGDEEPSFFVRRCQKSNEFPPLFVKEAWTKSVPHKDTFEFYRPSETIGEKSHK